MSIEIRDCNFAYPGTTTGVENINLQAAQGELIAVIGASGSGKTTLLKLVAGFEHPNTGSIHVNGRDVTHLPGRERNLGVVFQSYALFPLMTCAENVAYPLRIRGINKAECKKHAVAMLERVGLGAFCNRYPGSMSGGQQQRVALARALVFNPAVLLLDEPLSALDAGLRVEMREEICHLQKEHGITALHVTHDQEEALSMATKIAVMNKGVILQADTPQAIYEAPNCRYVANFVGHGNLWDGKVVSDGRVEVPFGEIACETKGYSAGSPVTVFVRLEHIHPSAQNDGEVNRFSGHVTRDTFLGALRRYEIALPGTDVVIKGESAAKVAPNTISILPEHVRLLPPE